MKDKAFIDKISQSEIAFSKGDILKVSMLTTQFKSPKGELKTEHEILKVLDHQPAWKQSSFPL